MRYDRVSRWLREIYGWVRAGGPYSLRLSMAEEINRRVRIEQAMLDAAKGKRPMPDAQTLRLWALALGTPESMWTEELRNAVLNRPEEASASMGV